MLLTFHKVRPGFSYSAVNYSPGRLRRLLRILVDHEYILTGHPLDVISDDSENNGRRVFLSFDDGYQHLRDALPPLIDEYRITPIVFMPSGLLGRTNNWDYTFRVQPMAHLDAAGVRELAELGAVFGSHGCSHVDLTRLSSDALRHELVGSKAALEDVIGGEISSISFPFGRANEKVTEAAAEAGYRFGFTMRFPLDSDVDLLRGRIPVYGYDSPFSVLHKLGRGPLARIERAKAWATNQLSGGTVLLNRLRGRE